MPEFKKRVRKARKRSTKLWIRIFEFVAMFTVEWLLAGVFQVQSIGLIIISMLATIHIIENISKKLQA